MFSHIYELGMQAVTVPKVQVESYYNWAIEKIPTTPSIISSTARVR